MSKKVKKVLGVVAAIAIPFAAPLIAGSAALAGVAGTIGSTATSALVGAGLGAAKAAVTGEDIGRAALMGGIGGTVGQLTGAGQAVAGTKIGQGVQGFFGGAAPAATTATSAVPSAPAAGLKGFLGNVGQAGLQTLTDPNNLIRAGINIAGEYAASQAAKLTPQEQAMFDALAQEQAWRMGISKEAYLANRQNYEAAINMVRNISPEAEGRRFAASVAGFEPEEIRKVRAATPVNQPGMLEQRERELGIAQAARRAEAFERGYEGGRSARIAGLTGVPAPEAGASIAGSYPAYYGPLREAAQARGISAGKFVGELGDIFFPNPKS